MDHIEKKNAHQILAERGFIHQETDSGSIERMLRKETCFYTGFDATAESLHVGNLMPIMATAHLQRAGHFPVIVIGGGTTMIGDPSGKTEMRPILGPEKISANMLTVTNQLRQYIVIDDAVNNLTGKLVDNANWLLKLNYIDFLRTIGPHFKVNEMIRSEANRLRLEREEGLSFIEFNYQVLQAYDYLVLHERFDCQLQIGGGDQWGNILAGVELIRRVKRQTVHGLTLPLLVTSTGKKMGKTESGTIWLDPEKTSPYNFYQFWINIEDADVRRFLGYLTFLSLEEIDQLCAGTGQELKAAKEVLAFEVTKLAHGQAEAERAQSASRSLFNWSRHRLGEGLPGSSIPRAEVLGISVADLFVKTGLCSSKNEAAAVIKQNGLSINDVVVTDARMKVYPGIIHGSTIRLRRGKKNIHIVTLT